MTTDDDAQLLRARLQQNLEQGVIPFWSSRAVDPAFGGYLTNFDAAGRSLPCEEKYLNTQCRLLWWFSRLSRAYPHTTEFRQHADAGRAFIIAHFWDSDHGGWRWKVRRDGSTLDDAKIVYGQSFAIYAFAEHALATGDEASLAYAAQTLSCLQSHAADGRHGGYVENLQADWTPAGSGAGGGDRKGLDTHMHLMEALTTLYRASGAEPHREKLLEVIDLIVRRMIDPSSGCGLNQFDLAWNPIDAIAIDRTWNAERGGPRPSKPIDTTSYGHNLELAWLLRDAVAAAKSGFAAYEPVFRRLVDHALERGLDAEYGGLYRDGLRDGEALVLEKEFWQQAEGLLGLIDAYVALGDARYLDAARNVWDFVERHMLVAGLGEWRVLVDRRGSPIDSNLGNPWKVSYHTGRALLESVRRLDGGERCVP